MWPVDLGALPNGHSDGDGASLGSRNWPDSGSASASTRRAHSRGSDGDGSGPRDQRDRLLDSGVDWNICKCFHSYGIVIV